MASRDIVAVEIGDVVALRKDHPCGANEWEVVRIGADIGLVCHGCGRKVMLPRSEFDRRYRKHLSHAKTERPATGDADS